MRIKTTQWAVWDKEEQKFVSQKGVNIFRDRHLAWLIAGKERKDSPFKVVKIKVSIQK